MTKYPVKFGRRAQMALRLALLLCVGLARHVWAEEPRFVCVVLGAAGGLTEGDLSSYLIAPAKRTDFVALDAGTLMTGLRAGIAAGSFDNIKMPPDSPLCREGHILRHHIKAYLLSHAHLDHVAGLVINAPDDGSKRILGLPSTIDSLRDHLFNWKIWPNFGDEGKGFCLKKYRYVRLAPGKEQAIDATAMNATPFALSHSGLTSTAFLIRAGEHYALYFGDTGPDEVEQSDRMKTVWQSVAPLVRKRKLCGLFLEVSYPDPHEDKKLYGHLTPRWMLKELRRLAGLVDPAEPSKALKDLKVIVTHIKPAVTSGRSAREEISEQLKRLNDLGVEFVFPKQGDRIEL